MKTEPKRRPFAFIGEKRSRKAISMRVRWRDGKLAAKQLFDALHGVGILPSECAFQNWFERGGPAIVRHLAKSHCLIAMGRKVQRALSLAGIPHFSITHPAARGKIRRKPVYIEHVRTVLKSATV